MLVWNMQAHTRLLCIRSCFECFHENLTIHTRFALLRASSSFQVIMESREITVKVPKVIMEDVEITYNVPAMETKTHTVQRPKTVM